MEIPMIYRINHQNLAKQHSHLWELPLLFDYMFTKSKNPVIPNYTSNPALKTIKMGWKGTTLDQDGLFINHEYPWVQKPLQVFKFMTGRNPQRDFKKNDKWRICYQK